MPFTSKKCPNCGKQLHTDDLLEGRCNECGKGLENDSDEEADSE